MLTKKMLVEHSVTLNLKVMSSCIKGCVYVYPVPIILFQIIHLIDWLSVAAFHCSMCKIDRAKNYI